MRTSDKTAPPAPVVLDRLPAASDRSFRLLVAGAALVALALVWAAAIDVRGLHGIPGVPLDAAWAGAMASVHDPVVVGSALVLAWLGQGPGGILLATAFALLLWRRRGLRIALVFLALAVASETNVNLMKAVDLRPRPNGALWGGIGSFPSGHTAYSAVLAVTAAALFERAWVWICGLAFVAAMALSRTVISAHWLTDTLAGAACGTALAVLVWALVPHAVGRSAPPTEERQTR